MAEAKSIRRPGRPQGSSRYKESDLVLLDQVAERLVANPELAIRAAIIRVVGPNDGADLRRLQAKFRSRQEQCMEKARMRAARVKEEVARRRAASTTPSTAQVPEYGSYTALARMLSMPDGLADIASRLAAIPRINFPSLDALVGIGINKHLDALKRITGEIGMKGDAIRALIPAGLDMSSHRALAATILPGLSDAYRPMKVFEAVFGHQDPEPPSLWRGATPEI